MTRTYRPFRTLRSALPGLLGLLICATPVHAEELAIHGSNTIGAKLAPMLVEGFLHHRGNDPVQTHSNGKENEVIVTGNQSGEALQVLVASHGSSTGFTALAAGNADVWASSRAVKSTEVEKMAERANLKEPESEHVIAIDGLAVLVHPSNQVDQLSIDTLAKIFSGEITDWSQIGGAPRAISLYARDDRSGTWDTFKSLVLGKQYTLHTSAKRYESNDRLSDDVSADPGGIGFSGLASVRNSKVLAISDGEAPALKPSRLTVASEDYPLSRRLFMYTTGNTTPDLAKEFLGFVLDEEGQAIVSRSGFVSQTPLAVKPDFDNSTPATFKRLTQNYRRLTVNFRFSEGHTKLDNKAQRDLQRVADYLNKEDLNASDLLLIGFADQQGDELRAQMVSELRALSVRKALSQLGIGNATHTGYGHYMPVGSTGGATGQQRNGRVEVWVRAQ
ncbi:substrate-binding domain-containing protein [Marinobacter sp. F3R11]|uniref:substrate-binding domain-containing protein n=1 Tax=Marinobacter sp. F3R11 TaxID=2267231 RepID=UPI000DE8EB0C|nr:phosphate ABC transporter substrate-binding/OmpA family protein [Marinobacter sp. F3R11]RBW49024.1 phosphate ABC transporter substrate-binding protein [Marinobacter sp. F3R11]